MAFPNDTDVVLNIRSIVPESEKIVFNKEDIFFWNFAGMVRDNKRTK